MNNILSINNLSVRVRQGADILRDVSFNVAKGTIVGVVGGSGSGKTTIGLASLGMLPDVMERVSGRIVLAGQNITNLSYEEMRALRGRMVSMAFQEPMSAFNPVMTIGAQITETVLAHENVSYVAARERVLVALRSSGLSEPRRVASSYAFELSGGLRQRAMIAQAIVCGPQLLIADEPTSSLDVDTQEKILDLFRELRRAMGLSIMLITHDLGVVRRVADAVVVLCEGQVVESGRAAQVLSQPRSEYTRILLAAEEL